MGSDSKPVVEISHGYSTGVLGGSRNVEQATKAIRGSTLRRIGVDYSGEETGGFQGDGCNAHGQPPNAETNPDSRTDTDLRCTGVLPGGHCRDPEVHDDMEAELVNFQGPAEEDGMEYDRSSHDES